MTNQPIDFVIIWVDGSDPAWQAEKKHWLEQFTGDPLSIDVSEVRYRDWGNLRYWFRSVEKYAPWVNQVHFVTWGSVPQWLNPDAPKLHIVRHEDFIPAEYLPTFSANPIELNLHRISGLSEQFVFFNDDFFLTAPVKPKDFFAKGLPCDSLAEQPIKFPFAELFNYILVNDMVFLSGHFNRQQNRRQQPGKWYSLASPYDCMRNILLSFLNTPHFFGMVNDHLPQPFLKQTLEEVWAAEPKLLHETCTHRFRDQRDVNQYIFKYWQQLTGNFTPYNRRKAGKAFPGTTDPHEIARYILEQRCKMICINDGDTVDFEVSKNIINNAFAQVLTEKSSFER